MDVSTLKKNVSSANKTAKNAIKYLVDCLYVYQQGDDSALGYMGYVLSKSFCTKDNSSPSGFKTSRRYESLIKALHDKKNTVLSTMGGTWQKDYKDVDPDKYNIKFTKEQKKSGGLKIFIDAGGRDIDFPVTVKKNNKGQWKVTDGFSSMLMDVRKPQSEVGDF